MSADAFIVMTVCFLLVFAFLFAGLADWALFLLAFTFLLGLAEWIVVKKTGKTLSRRFGEFRARHPLYANILLILLLAAAIALVLHLIAMTPPAIVDTPVTDL